MDFARDVLQASLPDSFEDICNVFPACLRDFVTTLHTMLVTYPVGHRVENEYIAQSPTIPKFVADADDEMDAMEMISSDDADQQQDDDFFENADDENACVIISDDDGRSAGDGGSEEDESHGSWDDDDDNDDDDNNDDDDDDNGGSSGDCSGDGGDDDTPGYRFPRSDSLFEILPSIIKNIETQHYKKCLQACNHQAVNGSHLFLMCAQVLLYFYNLSAYILNILILNPHVECPRSIYLGVLYITDQILLSMTFPKSATGGFFANPISLLTQRIGIYSRSFTFNHSFDLYPNHPFVTQCEFSFFTTYPNHNSPFFNCPCLNTEHDRVSSFLLSEGSKFESFPEFFLFKRAFNMLHFHTQNKPSLNSKARSAQLRDLSICKLILLFI